MFERLIADVKSLNLPLGSYALFGSAPIIARGLREASHDIDIVVKKDVLEEYKNKPGWKLQTIAHDPARDDQFVEWEDHNIELWDSWGPGEWDLNTIIDEAEIIDGIPYVRLETVLEWKERNNRPKDSKDAELIKTFLADDSESRKKF